MNRFRQFVVTSRRSSVFCCWGSEQRQYLSVLRGDYLQRRASQTFAGTQAIIPCSMLRSVMMMLQGVLLCMAALQVLTPTLARSDGLQYGGHDHGHDPRHRKERFWGEHGQSQLLPGEQLPLNFTWCHPSGEDTMCTPSWNQRAVHLLSMHTIELPQCCMHAMLGV